MYAKRSTLMVLSLWICAGNPLQSQHRLAAEVEQMVAPLVMQINARQEIRTIAIADFTDLNQNPTLLGKLIAEEFLTAFIQATEKNFSLVSRNHLAILFKEAGLGESGALSEENIPKLGKLKGIDLILTAVLTPSSDYIRVNVQGVEIESGNIVAAKNGNITLTPLLKDALAQAPGNLPETKEPLPIKETIQPTETAFRNGALKVSAKGCRYSGDQLQCDFTIVSEGADTELSLYVASSAMYVAGGNAAGYPLRKIQLEEQSGNSRITRILRANQSYQMVVSGPMAMPQTNGLSGLKISCFSPQLSRFEMNFSQIPILR